MKIEGARLIAARERKMWNQRDLARAAGLAYSTLHRIETGKRQPTMPTLRRLVEALEIDLDDLLDPSERAPVGGRRARSKKGSDKHTGGAPLASSTATLVGGTS